MEIDILGIDLAKQVFQLHGADRCGRAVYRAKVLRDSLFEAVRALTPRIAVMEACGTAHHWARRFHTPNIEVRVIGLQYITPFVKTNSNDRNDAEAIVEAASRPTMRFVTAKSVEQQDILAAHRMRAILLRHRTALINHMRGLLGERGLTISRSPEAFRRAVPELLRMAADELTAFSLTLLTELLQHLTAIEERIHLIDISVQTFMKHSELCKKIAAVPGIGPNPLRQSSAQSAMPRNSGMAGIMQRGWFRCHVSTPLAENRDCTESAGAVTLPTHAIDPRRPRSPKVREGQDRHTQCLAATDDCSTRA